MLKTMNLLSVCLLLFLLTACNPPDAQSPQNSQGSLTADYASAAQNLPSLAEIVPDIQNNPDAMIEAYTSAFLSANYAELSQYLYADPRENRENYEFNIEIWNSIDVKSVEMKDQDLRETRGYYTIEIEFHDVGKSSFEKGLRSYYAWVEKKEDGKWYVFLLTAADPPDEEWLTLEK